MKKMTDYPWFKSYGRNIPQTIDIKEYDSIIHILDESAKKFHSLPAYHSMGKTYNYKEVDDLSKKFAVYLEEQVGLKKGEHLALMMPNILQYPIALFGGIRAGLTIVNINPLYTERELGNLLKTAEVSAIVIYEGACHTLQKVLPKIPIGHILTTQIGDFLAFPKSAVVNLVVKRIKKLTPPWDIPNSIDFKKAVLSADETRYERPPVELSETAFIQYTGGTTGDAKGACLTHQNICANIIQIKAWIKELIKPKSEVVITPLPLYHIFSLTANCLTFFAMGGVNILIPDARDIDGLVTILRKWRFTVLTGVNTLFHKLLEHPEFQEIDFSSLKMSLGGGMAVRQDTAQRWKKTTGAPLIEAYGLTETSPAVCINPMNLKDFNGKIGLPISSTIVSIKDDEGRDLPLLERGEICVKGPQVMKGYLNRPDETAKVMTPDGHLKTGDVGFMDEAGFVEIVDRKKDMIISSGLNIFPNEVEDVLTSHPKVFEAAAIGVPDSLRGEAVKVFVVKRDSSLTPEELKTYCKKHLTNYKVPQYYEFRDTLPKSNVGKILRKNLRDL